VLRAVWCACERGAWIAMGLGLGCWELGEVLFTIDPGLRGGGTHPGRSRDGRRGPTRPREPRALRRKRLFQTACRARASRWVLIIAVCDAFHAMTVDRSYHRGIDPGDAIADLRRKSGSQFDPEIVEVFSARFGAALGLPSFNHDRVPEPGRA
jgi:hypothetical protein